MMKKIWKMRKDKSAVSPVIATILMVAITVVLAAVLYVMVMGFGGNTNNTPTGSFTSVTGANTNKIISIGVVSPTTKWSDVKISLQAGTNGPVVSSAITAPTTTNVTITLSGYSIAGTNLASNGNVNSGDTLTVWAGLTAGTTYTVTMIHVPTGGSICSKTFTA
jgi:archaeal type IV pilus assembly protein PilA